MTYSILATRLSVVALSVISAGSVQAATDQTETVKGRKPTVTDVQIHNRSAPGLNPAQGDQLETTYIYTDPDGTPEDFSSIMWSQSDGGTISGSEGEIFVPGAEQLDSTLRSRVKAWSQEPSDPLYSDDILSAPTAAPVLPPRAEFDSLWHVQETPKRWGDAYMECANNNMRLPSTGELQEMFVDYTRAKAVGEDGHDDLQHTYGHVFSYVAWANSTGTEDRHEYVYVKTDGHIANNLNSNLYTFACARFGGAEGLPTVTNVNVPDPVIGTALTATYTYNGNATIPDRSRFQWYRADDAAGTGKTAITGATAVTYTPLAEDAGKWLIIEITPASYDTVVGTMVSDASGVSVPAAEQAFPPGTTLRANDGQIFGINSGFPSTAVAQASFRIQISGDASSNSGYTWSTDHSEVRVDTEGNVTLPDELNSSNNEFTIKAVDSSGVTYTKSFLIQAWYYSVGAGMSWNEANNYCNNTGMRMPSQPELTDYNANRRPYSLWGEWGNIGWGSVWSSTPGSNGGYDTVYFVTGSILEQPSESHYGGVCRRDLS